MAEEGAHAVKEETNAGAQSEVQTPSKFRTLLQLTKAKIAIAVLISSAMGYLMAAGAFSVTMVVPLFGVLLLAMGSLALNQCQEVSIDARMKRTSSRPIQTGRIDRVTSLFIALLLILIGAYALASTEYPTEQLILGAFALVWYNGVYTYLKRVTAFAVVPGAAIGAVPPAMGWVAAGGSLNDPMILLVAAFYFIWQIPHFWLLLSKYGDEYAKAGLPSLTTLFTPSQLGRVTFMWVLATAAAGLVFPAFSPQELHLPWRVALLLASVWLAFKATSLLPAAQKQPATFRKAFIHINIYALLVSLFLSLNGLMTA